MHQANDSPDPAKIRQIFGQNLRVLSRRYPSVAGLCRDLGINRTQFNRYLSGESFPRPDVLHRICLFFDVDARILLEPVENLRATNFDLVNHPDLNQFLGRSATRINSDVFPTGFFQFSRRSFMDRNKFVTGLIYVYRDDGYTLLRGYEPRRATGPSGQVPPPADREFRGFVLETEHGIAALVSRRKSISASFSFLARRSATQSTLWEGYVTRLEREDRSSERATRLVYEYLGNDRDRIFRAARSAGLNDLSDLTPIHAQLLKPQQTFA